MCPEITFCVCAAGDLGRIIDGPRLAPEPTQGADLVHLAVAPEKSEEISIGIVGITHDFAQIVYAKPSIPKHGAMRPQGAEIDHLSVAEQERVRITVTGAGSACDLSEIINRVAVAESAPQCWQRGHFTVAENECAIISVSQRGIPDGLSRGVYLERIAPITGQ